MLEIFGTRLKTARIEKRITQKDLGESLNVSTTTVCQWETHKQEPSLTDIVKICKLLNVNSDYLVGLEDEYGNKLNT